MSIVSGYKKFKKYILTSSGFQLVSHWTNANTLQFDDGKTAQAKLGAIDGISSSKDSSSDKIAASTKLVSELNSNLTTVNQNLGGIRYDPEKDSLMLLRNNKWVYWKKCYSTKYKIFKNGTWAENLTPNFRCTVAGHCASPGYAASYDNNAITLTWYFHSNGATGKTCLWDKYDLTDYSKLVCMISGRALGDNGWYHFGATTDLEANDNFAIKMDVSNSPLNVPVELNISSLSGEYYIGFSHYHQNWDKSIIIPQIYLIAD